MRVFITGDSEAVTGVTEVVLEISGPTVDHFSGKNYGDGLGGVIVVLMCCRPDIRYHRRLRFVRKEKKIYMDIMLDYREMRRMKHKDRMRVVVGRLIDEVPATIQKYSIQDFDESRFLEDLRNWLQGLIKEQGTA